MNDVSRTSKKKLAEAKDLLDAIMNFAYLHGFHECGYNPAKVLTDEIERLNSLPGKEQDSRAMAWALQAHEDLSKMLADGGGNMLHVRANRALGILFAEVERLEKILYPIGATPEPESGPASLVGALQDSVHRDPGPSRVGRAVKSGRHADQASRVDAAPAGRSLPNSPAIPGYIHDSAPAEAACPVCYPSQPPAPVRGVDLVSEHDRGYAEGYSDAVRWQPIETAPKNGNFQVCLESCPELSWPAHSNNGELWSKAHGPLNRMVQGRFTKATHWRPAHSPPTKSGEQA
jgi:hypothetical protein